MSSMATRGGRTPDPAADETAVVIQGRLPLLPPWSGKGPAEK